MKNWEGCLPTLYTKILAQPTKIASSARAWTTSTKKCAEKILDITGAPIVELLTDPAWRPDRETGNNCFWVSQPSPQSAPWRTQKPHPCPDCWQIPSHCLDSCLHRRVCRGRNEKWRQRSLHQVPRWWHHFPLSSYDLKCSNYRAEILAICTAAEHLSECWKAMGNIAIFIDSLVNPTSPQLSSADPDQVIQDPCQADSWVPSVPLADACSCGTDRVWNSRQTCKHRQSDSTDTEPCHLQKGQDTSPLTVQWTLEERQRWISGTPWPKSEAGAGPTDHYFQPEHWALWSEFPSEEDWHFRLFSVVSAGQANQIPDHVLQSCPKYA